MSVTETDLLRLSRRIKAIEDLPQAAGEISLSEVGAVTLWPCDTPPESWLICDGSDVSRTEYANLFGKLCRSKGNAAVSIASPAVVTLPGHGLSEGDRVFLNTSGALPSGLYDNTQYYVKQTSADTFSLSLTPGGDAIIASGSQSGSHTVFTCPWGISDAATFRLPDLKGRAPVGKSAGAAEFDSIGESGGEIEHTLAAGEMPDHSHTVNPPSTDTGIESVNHTHTANPGEETTSSASALIGYSTTGCYFPSSGTYRSVVTSCVTSSHTHTFNAPADTTTTDSTDHRHTVDIAEFDTGSAGSGAAHNNLQPYVVLNFIIRYESYVLPKKGDRGDKGEKGDRGDAAPQIVAAYSADAQSWHSGYLESDDYIRFSVDGAITWGGAVYIRGRQGEQGIQGVKGDTGVSYRMRGEYDDGTSYVCDGEYIDCVTYNGSTYYAKQDTAGNIPSDAGYWGVLALKGMDGTGTGDVIAPASNTADKLPQWNGSDTKTLKDGVTIADIVAAAKQAVYPVGSLYYNANDGTNPATLLGFGTWDAFGAGRVPVGFASGDADFGTIGATPGEKEHTLAATEIPAHAHTMEAHNHGPGTLSGYYKTRNNDDSGSAKIGALGYSYSAFDINASADSLIINNGLTADAVSTMQNAGGGGAHNNIQPSIVVYIWKRTA